MGYAILALSIVVTTIYALVDCARSTDDEVRGLNRAAWIIVILVSLPLLGIGALAYLVLGRTRQAPGTVLAPDDDPEFLRSLALRRHREQRAERERRERERQRQARELERQALEQERQALERDAGSTPPERDDPDGPGPQRGR